MTTKQIEAKMAQEMLVFETAKRIREILDAARKSYGGEAWDDGDKESAVLELVTEDDNG